MPQQHRRKGHRTRLASMAVVVAGLSLLASTVAAPAAPVPAAPAPAACDDSRAALRYVVLFNPTTPQPAAMRETKAHCGSLSTYYSSIGVGVVESSDPAFAERIGTGRAYSAQRDRHAEDTADNQAVATSTGATSTGRFDSRDRTSEQWDMRAIEANRARKATPTPGGSDVLVGVLDSAIDTHHPELARSIDPTRSADCVTGAPGPMRPWRPGESSHGTHVAGIIGAADDGRGVTGVAPGVRLASVRVVNDRGYADPESAVCGFMWSAQHGVTVANTSFLVESAQRGCGPWQGSPVPREAVRRAVDYANSRGVLSVAAVGNERSDVSAAYGQQRPNCDAVPVELDHVLAVSAATDREVKAGYSSYGLGAVDLTAPGGASTPPRGKRDGCVLSTVPGGYGTACGTSMATPHVTGVAALAAQRHPNGTPRELTQSVVTAARPMRCPPDYDLNADDMQDALCRGYVSYNGFYGHGMVDAFRTVTR